ncbi:Trm112 family protein [Rhodoligotrophos ferricapiens]|uniref:Trm112 family protein n=1 Tax=Rhodoligotrophos ferricapiens TaxID=3069264 RepID=UPI00315D5885
MSANDLPEPSSGSREAQTPRQTAHGIDPKLLEILVCPLTKTVLIYDRDRQELISKAAGLAYPIRDGIPIMLPDEARELSNAERD